MRRDGVVKAIALLLAVGMVLGFASTYLAQAGVPGWLIILLVLVVLAVPVVAAVRSGRRER
ncbi:hypothetical protein A8924_6102 [Saccharopolyspora erythraea NRRL 2338]|uniref:Uncharacterized protein n=2 Tax=Saccharopolyspora erythraea TaxID=1836 RepID=A4FLM0_SACEN|nr:hypothetical protein [Saccharopolyspora erythraea]EQD83861.1 hypothetical protein N599_22910 [Saccharopolyspora erythraea D]PFG98584.1 hypothetical protein A8924_6102 [Saccharopolyspora erythraea NRRL 2338]QRK88622.1 hypothetical protein JQX30_28865 [Saccharopolyspora erythraea]CAM04945.1 hypothetical protein SACE_5760 [Saccharopolyspora erythraea NRRL 2338]